MTKNNLNQIFYAFLALLLASMACATAAPEAPTPTPAPTKVPATNTPQPTPTKTVRPTSTPKPTFTPDVVATEIYDNLFSHVLMFEDEGLISSSDGGYIELDDFREEFAQIGWLRYWYFDDEFDQFVFNADIKWSTAMETSDTSGCGIVFGVQEGGTYNDYYGVVLDKSRIYFTITKSKYYYELGKTRGTGRLDFGNPAEAEFTLLVSDDRAFVYVNDEFIGEYTLSKDRDTSGKFGYGIISGTNRDYGTRCEIRNARLWDLNP